MRLGPLELGPLGPVGLGRAAEQRFRVRRKGMMMVGRTRIEEGMVCG